MEQRQHPRSTNSFKASSSSSSSSLSSVLPPSPHHAALGANAPPGEIVTPVSLETVLHDMVVAGHYPDSSSATLLMRGLKACAILGTAVRLSSVFLCLQEKSFQMKDYKIESNQMHSAT